MDLDAGHGAALGRILRGSSTDIPLTTRLRSLLTRSASDDDPVGQLVRTHRSIHPSADTSILRRGYAIAESMHRGQYRKSGDPYITHPLAVAQICAELGMDTTTLVAALLHDTVEDTRYTLQALQADFGPEVAHLVDGVTKFDKEFYGKAAEAETIRKMIIAAGKDVRVLIVKLADRLHNMRTLDARSPASRARIARATLEVLVPLCDRLGIQKLKRELDDAVLYHLEPEAYERIDQFVRERRPELTSYLSEVTAQARLALKREKIDAKVTERPRHYYSIWRDTIEGGHNIPYNPPRIAIVIDGPETDCYAALGAIHGLWRPVPGRFKDYIATPKHNLYRSLHTTVIGPGQRSVEVLIRTEAMHRVAEYGIAAHFRFPKLRDAETARADQLAWLRRVLDWQQEAADPVQFLQSLRCDLAEGQIQVFAGGRPILLPAGATPVDVAYELGRETGDHCVAATINGRLAPLSSELEEGDVVEIFTAPEEDPDNPRTHTGPQPEWLDFVKSPHARMQINRWFAEHQEPTISIADKVRLGRATIGLMLSKYERGIATEAPLRRLAEEMGYPDLETLLVAVVDRTVDPNTVVEQLIAMVDSP
ncbi:MAG: GTP pyrophosphokinase [Actinobacteria bacterium]|nr:MAG: GTP pyrophosphokinase [Actinomycetota bacterium]